MTLRDGIEMLAEDEIKEHSKVHPYSNLYKVVDETGSLYIAMKENESDWPSYMIEMVDIGEQTADRILTAFSGHGIVSGYTDDPRKPNLSELVPPYYEKVGRNGFVLPSGRTVTDIPWDFDAWQPDDIVVNLGTNDLSWCGDDTERKAEFRRMYTEFLKTVRKNNPTARMLCILGAMGEGLNEEMAGAVRDYAGGTGDRRIRSAVLREQDGARNGFGANWHPSVITQQELAETVLRMLENQ